MELAHWLDLHFFTPITHEYTNQPHPPNPLDSRPRIGTTNRGVTNGRSGSLTWIALPQPNRTCIFKLTPPFFAASGSRPLRRNHQWGRARGAGLGSSSTQFESEPTVPSLQLLSARHTTQQTTKNSILSKYSNKYSYFWIIIILVEEVFLYLPGWFLSCPKPLIKISVCAVEEKKCKWANL